MTDQECLQESLAKRLGLTVSVKIPSDTTLGTLIEQWAESDSKRREAVHTAEQQWLKIQANESSNVWRATMYERLATAYEARCRILEGAIRLMELGQASAFNIAYYVDDQVKEWMF